MTNSKRLTADDFYAGFADFDLRNDRAGLSRALRYPQQLVEDGLFGDALSYLGIMTNYIKRHEITEAAPARKFTVLSMKLTELGRHELAADVLQNASEIIAPTQLRAQQRLASAAFNLMQVASEHYRYPEIAYHMTPLASQNPAYHPALAVLVDEAIEQTNNKLHKKLLLQVRPE